MPDFALLREIVARVVASPYSDFYRSLYGVPAGSVPHIYSKEEWQLLPYFTKEAFLERPVHEFTFVPRKEVEAVYYTSGTSGKPPAFLSWLSYKGSYSYRKAFHPHPRAVLTTVKAPHRTGDEYLKDMDSLGFGVGYDGKRVKACVQLAKAAGVDTLSVHTYTIPVIGEEMKRIGINTNIKLIDYVGETCSLAMYSYMRETFPNAKIISFYSMSEAEGIVSVPCREHTDEEPYTIVHVNDGFHVDLIDSETGAPLEPKADVEAEVLITHATLGEFGFPLIRYRPGDTVRVIETTCAQHGKWSFTVLGKTASDSMLVPGGQLRADEVERVLRIYKDEVTDHFELHRYDAGTSERPMLKLELKVTPVREHVDVSTLATMIAKELRVAPGRTYAQGVEEGRYLPLVCSVLEPSVATKKHRRMIKH